METATKVLPVETGITTAKDQSTQTHQNDAARKLLHDWLSDTSGYDETSWPQVKKVIEENRLSPRSRFDD